MKQLMLIGSFLIGLSAFAGAWDDGNTWFVATNGADVAASSGGGTEAAPFRTLQFAHDQASAGDTIKLTPGIYDYETHSDGKHNDRLVVGKKLRFVSTNGRKVTAIEGRLDSGKSGPLAVRCVYVKTEGYDSEFHDLTFRNGGSSADEGSSDNTGCSRWGGCIHVYGGKSTAYDSDIHRAYFVDCDIIGGAATWGAGMAGGTAIRCFFRDNFGSSYGSTAMGVMLWNCVIFSDRNSADRPAIGNNSVPVNCTVYGGQKGGCNRSCKCYNTFFANMGSTEMGTTSSTTYDNCIGGKASGDQYQLMSPATGDFRPIAGKPIVGGGKTEYLTTKIKLPTDTKMTDFYGNPLDLESETCNVGAVQGEGVTPGTGYILVRAGETAEGWVNGIRDAYSYAASFPATLVVKPASEQCFRIKGGNGFSGVSFLYPQMDGTIHLVYPADPTTSKDYSEVLAKGTFWADPQADAATADGTEEHPFRTLQDAMDHIAANGLSEVVVLAKPGVYAEGGSVTNGVMNRVVMPNSAVLLKSVGGAAVTTIRGAADPGSTSVEFPGCGPAAVRCVTVPKLGSNAAIQGFTFADGRTDCAKGGLSAADSDTAAGVCCYGAGKADTLLQVLDCTFTNCIAPQCAAFYGGFCTRCRFTDIVSYGGIASYCHLSGCLVEGSCRQGPKPAGAGDFEMFPADCRTFHCTISNGVVFCGTNNQRNNFSTVFVKSQARGNYYYYGSVFDPQTTSYGGTGYDANKQVLFADAANGDYRLVGYCPAALGGILPETSASYYSTWAKAYANFVSSGLDGSRIRFHDGVPLAGCMQTLKPGANISIPYGGIAVTGAEEGCHAIEEGASITIAADIGHAKRPCLGYVLNGETNLFPVVSRTLSYEELQATDGFRLEAIYGTDWYVNPDPTVGDDANDGFTRETPKRTLAGVMSVDVLSGDTVHAAAGTYDEGTMKASDDAAEDSLRSRVTIPRGVTLVSDEGAAKTFIVGSRDLTDGANEDGFGTNAVRGVYLRLDATLKGFTVTGCWTRFTDDGWSAEGFNYCGGGIRGEDASKRDRNRVYDCVFSNNWARLGGAIMGVSAIRCLLLDNHATAGAGAVYISNLYGSLVDYCYSGETAGQAGTYDFGILMQSTFGSHNWNYAKSLGNRAVHSGYSTSARVSGCLVLGTCNTMGRMTNVIENTVFADGAGSLKYNADTCFVGSKKSAEWADAEMRPVVGANPGIDRALAEDLEIPGLEKDATGFQRVMNGAPDIGALEADWRGRYAEDILGRKFAVEAADKMVEETESRSVLVPEGTSLVGEILNRSARETPYLLKFVVPEDGSLTVTVDGQAKDYTAGTYEITVDATAATLPVTFASTAGTAQILRGKCLAGIVLIVR